MNEVKKKRVLERVERIRSRLFCNQLSLALLGASHDFDQCKASELIAHPASPVKSEATFMSWWNGTRKIQRRSLENADQAVPAISRWFTFEHIGSPMQRHLGALRTLSLEVGHGDWIHRKRKRIDDGVASAQAIWSTFWAVDHCPQSGPLSMGWQLKKLGKKLSEPTYRYADELCRVRAEAGLFNAHAFDVTNEARASYASRNESGLFRFLFALLFELEVDAQQWWPLLVLDLGTAAAHCRARMSVDARDPYTVYGARDLNWIFTISRALWAGEKSFVGSLPSSARSVSLDVSVNQFVKRLLQLRGTYQSLVNSCGVSHTELAMVARPETDYVTEAAERWA